ncbi:UNVERIFIED_CONTAM: Retrovirus-related Pol polyprotein from transposon [Sesamum indicum]
MKEKEMAMISFLRENMDVFAWSPSDFTRINPEVIIHRLNVDPTMRPVQQKKRSFGGDKNEIIREEVDKLLKADSTAGFEMFSMTDAYHGYHQIYMAEEDRDKTSFITEKEIYCYNMMPFGLKNAGATYQRLVNKMFGDMLGKTMELHVDDMLIKSKRSQDHLADLAQAFAIMRSYGMKLNPNKCTLRVGGGKFFGLYDKSLPFFMVLQKPKSFEWDEECERALQELKEYLTTPPLLANTKDGEALFLYLSVSENAVSVVLVREEGGQQNSIYYVSKMLQGAELRYMEMEKVGAHVSGHRSKVATILPVA